MIIKKMAMIISMVSLVSMAARATPRYLHDLPASDGATSLVDMGPGCILRVANLFGGKSGGSVMQDSIEEGPFGYGLFITKKKPIETLIEHLRVSFRCKDKSAKTIKMSRETYLGIFDEKKREWVPYYLNDIDREEREHVTRFYPIKSVNAEGFAVAIDDTIGDEWRRRRMLRYCLFHGEKLLCGGTEVMYLTDPKGDLTPYALEVLRSIEFIDSSPPSSMDAASHSSPHNGHSTASPGN